MKRKFVICFLIGIGLLSLTSCRVNWGSTHYEVPWWAIAIPVVAFVIFVFVSLRDTSNKK